MPEISCACGAPETYSLNPAEVVVHAGDGCTIERAEQTACRITPDGWCAEHSTGDGPRYCTEATS
jgi:hypothetical protein